MESKRNLEDKLIQTSAAREAVLYANTPAYLYERLRKDTSVSYVAHELSTEEILRSLQEIAGKASKNPLELTRTYIFLVALSLKDDLKSYRGQFEALDLKSVEWAKQIQQLILNEKVPTTFSKIVYQSGKTIVSSSTSSGHASGIVLVPGKD